MISLVSIRLHMLICLSSSNQQDLFYVGHIVGYCLATIAAHGDAIFGSVTNSDENEVHLMTVLGIVNILFETFSFSVMFICHQGTDRSWTGILQTLSLQMPHP